jgi:hypothetical protein
LDLDDQLRLLQAPLEPGVLALELLDPPLLRGRRLAGTLALLQSRQGFPPPLDQVRGVQPLTPQQRPDLALAPAALRGLDDLQLVRRREVPPAGPG